MRYRHQEALTKSVMLGHASQTSGVMQNVHDKPGNLPDPDIFTFDTSNYSTTTNQTCTGVDPRFYSSPLAAANPNAQKQLESSNQNLLGGSANSSLRNINEFAAESPGAGTTSEFRRYRTWSIRGDTKSGQKDGRSPPGEGTSTGTGEQDGTMMKSSTTSTEQKKTQAEESSADSLPEQQAGQVEDGSSTGATSSKTKTNGTKTSNSCVLVLLIVACVVVFLLLLAIIYITRRHEELLKQERVVQDFAQNNDYDPARRLVVFGDSNQQVPFITGKKCFTVRILQLLHHKFVSHDRENLPCKLPKGKQS